MKKLASFVREPMVLLFVGALLLISVLDVIFSDKPFSEVENRELAQRPTLTVEGLFDLSFGKEYDEYLADQFVGRDGWITLKSLLWTATGRTENNGILYGKDGYLFEKMFEYDEEKFERNLGYLEKFAQSCPSPLTLVMIPNSFAVYPEKLPAGAAQVDQASVIEDVYARFSDYAGCVDLLAPLRESDTPYLYYRTDHHWTTDGAYIGYEALCRSLGLTPVGRSAFERREVPDFYGTYYSKCKKAGQQPDTIVWYPIPDVEMTVRAVTREGEFYTTDYDTLYNEAQFAEYDKYAAFLYSNNDLTVIRNGAPSPEAAGKSVCVIKDSYGNSLIPFLTQNYETVAVVDVRYFTGSLSEYLTESAFDRVVVLYGFSTFTTENIARISY